MRSKHGEGRRIADAFFTRASEDSSYFDCKCGTKRKKIGMSYSNLVPYVREVHPEYKKVINPDGTFRQSELNTFFNPRSHQTCTAGCIL